MAQHSDKQKERQQRGKDFQDELRRSWLLVPHSWRMRIPDGKGGTRPADEIILLEDFNILGEAKRTAGDRFEFSFLEPNQATGLRDFDQVIQRNYGMVFVSFLNEDAAIDEAYAFRLLAAMHFFKRAGRLYITLDELRRGEIPRVYLQRVIINGEPGYDLKGVGQCYKYLAEIT